MERRDKAGVQYLTPEQVADQLQVTVRTVYACLRTGELRSVRFGRQWRIHPDDLDAYLHRGTRCQDPPAADGGSSA